jgi:ABC-type phosphate transport system substrate-binding protein
MASRRTFLGAVAVGLLCGASVSSFAAADEELAVIVNTAHPAKSLDATQLRLIFQTVKANWDHGEQAVPVNLPDADPLRHAFDEAVLGLDPERAARYWKDRKIRGGARAPLAAPSTQAVLKVIALKAGAVGYVRANEVNATVKVIAKIKGGKLVAP